MQQQMERLQGTTGPQERQKLMQENMAAMRGLGGPMMMGSGQPDGMAMGGQEGMAGGDMTQRQEMMEKRTDMMQRMMAQIAAIADLHEPQGVTRGTRRRCTAL